jgi:hypothetical protein
MVARSAEANSLVEAVDSPLDVSVGPAHSPVPLLGFNARPCDEYMTNPWSNPDFVGALARTHPGFLRYPGGTIANNWNWKTGGPDGKPTSYLTSNLKTGADIAGFVPIFCVNVETHDLQHALNGLAMAEAQGLPIKFVEMGNELYLSGGQAAFPTGREYGELCQTWIAAIKIRFPGAKCAFAGTPNTANARRLDWDKQVISACTNFDAITFHQYWSSQVKPVSAGRGFWGTKAQQDAQWAALKAPGGLETMLSQPNDRWNAMREENDAPTNADIWYTEFNLTDTVGPTRQTWAHGLFLANAFQTLFQDGRVSMISPHMWYDGNEKAKTCVWGHGGMLSGLLEGAEQGDLSPWKYDLAVGGIVVGLFSDVMRDKSEISPLLISPLPVVTPPNHRDPYPGVYGWKFTGDGEAAILVNVSAQPYVVNTRNVVKAGSLLRQAATNPFTYINCEAKLPIVTTTVLTPTLTLPAYSITQINGTAPVDIRVAPAQKIFRPVSDTWLDEAAPGTPHGSDPTLTIGMSSHSRKRALLQFVVKDISKSVTSAKLRLYSPTCDYAVSLNAVGNMWDEMDLRWSTQPRVLGWLNTQTPAHAHWVEFDVTAAVKGPGLYSFALEPVAAGSDATFSSKEGSHPPQLLVTTNNTAPTFAARSLKQIAATVSFAYDTSIAADASDADGDPLTFTKTNGPAWLAVWSNGTLSGTPTDEDLGVDKFTVRVTDAAGLSADATLSIAVNGRQLPKLPLSQNRVPPANTKVVRFRSSEDTTARGDKPDSNFNFIPTLDLASNTGVGYLKFEVAHLPAGEVTEAKLWLYLVVAPERSSGVNTFIYGVPDSQWSGRSLTWKNRPPLGNLVTRQDHLTRAGWCEFDVTNYVTKNGAYSFGLKTTTPDVKWASRESNTAYVGLCAEPTLNVTVRPGSVEP